MNEVWKKPPISLDAYQKLVGQEIGVLRGNLNTERTEIDERIQLGIQALDAIKMSPCHLQRRNFFAADFRCDFQKR